MRKEIILLIVLFVISLISGCSKNPDNSQSDVTSLDIQKNMCETDSDCEYIWYAGGCYMPEYVAEVMKACADGIGPCPSEAREREGITCTCENNICVTHESDVKKITVSREEFPKDDYYLRDISINGDVLTIDIQYGGGCEEHVFEIVWSGGFAKSNPMQAEIYLSHDANGDTCEALPSETLRFDVTKIYQQCISEFVGGRNCDEIIINFMDSDGISHKLIRELKD